MPQLWPTTTVPAALTALAILDAPLPQRDPVFSSAMALLHDPYTPPTSVRHQNTAFPPAPPTTTVPSPLIDHALPLPRIFGVPNESQ